MVERCYSTYEGGAGCDPIFPCWKKGQCVRQSAARRALVITQQNQFDNRRSLCYEPWWKQMLYVAEINIIYVWRKLWNKS